MNTKYNEFINFLNYIGIITERTKESFNKSLNKFIYKNKKQNNIYSILSEILENYLNMLIKEDKISIAKTIVLRYKENKESLIKNILIKLLKNKEKQFLMFNLVKWERKVFSSNYEMKQNKSELFNNYNYSNEITHLTPLDISTIDLINRQQQYMNKYKQNKINQLKENEKLNNELCPFTPIIYTKNSFNEKKFLKNSERNPYKRLYDDLEKRQNKKDRIQYDKMLTIKKNSMFKTKNPISKKLRKMKSKERIDQLYNDYKIRRNNQNLLQKEIDNERGLTFSPFFITKSKSSKNSSYRIKTVENSGY